MDSGNYWDNKIIEWEDSMKENRKVSFVEGLASKFRKPLKVRSDACLDLLKECAKGKNLLELGCGSGFFAFKVYREVKPSKITAVDISHNAIERAKKMQRELKIKNNLQFIKSDVSTMQNLPKADITLGLGFLDYLNPKEIEDLFKNMKSDYFMFTFSEKKFSLWRYIHIIYLLSQRCPKHYYYTKREIAGFAKKRYKGVRIISGPELSFGCIVHNLPI